MAAIRGGPIEILSRHRVFSTNDVDEASEFAGRIWEPNRTTIVEGTYGLRWNHLEGDRGSISYIEHDCTVDLKTRGPVSDHYRFFLHESGPIDHRIDGRVFQSHPDSVVTHAPDIDVGLFLAPCSFLLVTLDGACVRRALEQRFRKAPPNSACLGILPQSTNLKALRSMVSWLATEVETDGSPLSIAGKPRLQAERLLLSLFVECLAEIVPKNTESVEDISRAQVRRAEEWIDANLTEPIGVEDVAAAIGVGVRSLQMSFKRVRGTSPHEIIMRRRLETARQMLLGAEEQNTTVTAVATSLGFFELGRFAQRYRQLFGEAPSMTLTRLPRRLCASESFDCLYKSRTGAEQAGAASLYPRETYLAGAVVVVALSSAFFLEDFFFFSVVVVFVSAFLSSANAAVPRMSDRPSMRLRILFMLRISFIRRFDREGLWPSSLQEFLNKCLILD
jgi:AraC-like DNA-binding protein